MKFSEYTITAKPEQSIDPLGFTQPFSALRNRLYGQFTVLSNAPVYHGMLALTYQVLAERKITPEKKDFARRFREAECLWGLACISAGKTLLNVTKYQAILQGRESFRQASIGPGNAIFRSLAYGTLGHYSSPSVGWGFLERGGVRLTPLGNRLADAFAIRGKQSLRNAVEGWLNGNEFALPELEALGDAYGLDSPAPPAERKVWEEAVDGLALRTPHSKKLWAEPPGEAELDDLRSNATHYSSFFPTLATRYLSLAETLDQARRFETLSAICLFIFAREYLLCHDAGPALPAAGALENNLVARLHDLTKEFLATQGPHAAKDWVSSLAAANDYRSAAAIIVQHHERHQKSKGAQPYMENGRLRVRERFDRNTFTSMHEELCAIPDGDRQIDQLTYHYRRDWHFDRALRYLRYFRGNT